MSGPPLVPRGSHGRRTLRPGIEGAHSGLTGSPDIPDPPTDGPTDLRGRLRRIRTEIRVLLSTMPRVVGPVSARMQ